ncbi:MAG: hypothetical protein COT74_00685 [Bdellovibrionales bacterium CG10_big_fil_rev_8_21_14_0_10_45_34]|nr:MAG: hypothetical protein COT74_00685 [Bdellovibrionales bacterium CG10_big_fil_rev_8_21_14_0_10_45_34]
MGARPKFLQGVTIIFEHRALGSIAPIILLVSSLGYFFVGNWTHEFVGLAILFSVQFCVFFWIARLLPSPRNKFPWILIFIGVASRVVVSFSPPILENDFWRYLWDGRVLASGFNPYTFAPEDPALDGLSVQYRQNIQWGDIKTIYPPGAVLTFAGLHLLFSDSVIALKVFLLGCDLATWFVLYKWLISAGKSPSLSFLYLLNPLVIKEIANSIHLDALVVLLLTTTLYFFWVRRMKLGWAALSLATSVKLFPIVLVPLIARSDEKWKSHLALYFSILLGLYAPFLLTSPDIFSGTHTFAQYWKFNAGIFQVATVVVDYLISSLSLTGVHLSSSLDNRFVTKVALGVAFLFYSVWQFKGGKDPKEIPKSSLGLIGTLLLLSPVVNAWYVLWVLPLSIFTGHTPWLVFSYLVVAAYSWHWTPELAPWFRTIEYAVFFGFWVWWLYSKRIEQKRFPHAISLEDAQ